LPPDMTLVALPAPSAEASPPVGEGARP
jgi:hypothetical protein